MPARTDINSILIITLRGLARNFTVHDLPIFYYAHTVKLGACPR